jgi:hemolysin activation/secretion protein
VLSGLAVSAPAAPREPADRLLDEQQLQREQQLMRRESPVLPVAAEPALDVAPASVIESGEVLRGYRIVLDDAGLLDEADMRALLAPYSDIDLGMARLSLLLRRIDAALVLRGLVTSHAHVRTVDPERQVIEIAVVPGRVAAIRSESADRRALGRAFPVKEGDVLDQMALEQGVQQINRLRARQASVQILPGARPGDSVLDIDVSGAASVGASAGVDNLGNAATGRSRLRAGLHASDLFGLFEDMQFARVHSAGSEATIASFALPSGYSTWSATYAASHSDVDVLGLALDTSVRTAVFGWNRVVGLNDRLRDAFDLSITRTRIARSLEDLALRTRRTSVLRLAWSRSGAWGDGQFLIEPALSLGLRGFGADEDAPGIPDTFVHNQFRKLAMTVACALPLSRGGVDLDLRLHAQHAEVALPAAEQIVLGGMHSVRGFDEALLAGDRGYNVRTELRLPAWQGPLEAALRAFLHLDAGRARAVGNRADFLSSFGAGMRGQAGGAMWEAVLSTPLAEPSRFPRDRWTVHFMFAYSI